MKNPQIQYIAQFPPSKKTMDSPAERGICPHVVFVVQISKKVNTMPKKFQPKKCLKTLSIGLSSVLALGISTASAAERMPNVLHEMVPHVILPETIQYNKTAKNLPGNDYTGVNSPFVGTYVAYPSYQAPYSSEFKTVGQSVYPVSPPMLPSPKQESESETSAIEEELSNQSDEMSSSNQVPEPIRLASVSDEIVPTLPVPNQEITQTGIFCQQPVDPPSAWAFSSPLFKAASVPAGWGGGQTGSINQNGIRGCSQQVGFQPMNTVDPAAAGAVPQGIPYSTFQMGRPAEQQSGAQAQILPNGMVLLTLPPNHANCGLIRCRADHAPRTVLLPPAPAGYNAGYPALPSAPAVVPTPQEMSMMPQFGMPMLVMTPMGPMMMGQQQFPAMNPMAANPAIMNPMAANPVALMNMTSATNSLFPAIQQVQLTTTQPSPAAGAETGDPDSANTPTESAQTATANQMVLVATPFGYYAMQPSADMSAQIAQLQTQMQGLAQPQMVTPQNPYLGVSATPFGYAALNPSGMYPQGAFMGGQNGMSVSDMIQLMMFINDNKPHQRRGRLFERISERRENRKETAVSNDPFTQLMQAWSTPYVSPDTTLRMPSRNAYPYGHFGVQASPISTSNYGGYHNLYFGNTTSPGLR